MITHKKTEQFGELSLIDFMYTLKDEPASVLVLITVGYLDGDTETQKDLLDKMEGYLGHIQSPEFKKDYPQDKIYLDVVLQEVPNQLILRLLYKCIPWCEECGATLRIMLQGEYIHLRETED